MKREVHMNASSGSEPAAAARLKRRAAKRAKNPARRKRTPPPRSELPPDELLRVRASGVRRQQEYRRRKRLAMGLPEYGGKGGRPRKNAATTNQPDDVTTG